MTRIACVADLHGHLPDIPDADLLLIGGDIVPLWSQRSNVASAAWLRDYLSPWVADIAIRMPVVGVAGNHDFIFQQAPAMVLAMDWTYLEDSGAEVAGFKVWGSPWQPNFGGWAYNLPGHKLKEKWDLIPDDIDILLLHGPPQGYGDMTTRGDITGPASLTRRIEAVRPRLVVCGHIHEARGIYQIGDTVVVNASVLDENYRAYPDGPIVVEI